MLLIYNYRKNVYCAVLKKLIAILLLSLFVFNTIGYRLLFNYMQTGADVTLTAKLDGGNYNESDLITVKIPVNMPYLLNQTNFERVDGEITFNGQLYKYVKRNVQNDTMTLLCIPNPEKTELQQKVNEYAGKVNGLPSNDNNKKAETCKQQISDFDVYENIALNSGKKIQAVSNLHKNTNLLQQFLPVNTEPPEISFSI
ncbi:hypothetical protein BH11BAC6_BH11BAC6_12050 [soil metagenome]